MDADLAPRAITLALTGNWKQAVLVNQLILKTNPQDIDALNRLARAYAELGNIEKAKICSQKVLHIDPINSIANKALQKWKNIKLGKISLVANSFCTEAFLEEPGKTKIVALMHLGSSTNLSELDSGDLVKLDCHRHRIAVITIQGKYIGRLPDDLSARLHRLVACGNKYEASIISIKPQTAVRVFIREVLKGKRAGNLQSF